eukprot:461165_1
MSHFLLLTFLTHVIKSSHCIPNDIVFWCISLDSISNPVDYFGDLIYAISSLNYTDPISGDERIQYSTSKTTSSDNLFIDFISCFPQFSKNPQENSLSINFHSRDASDQLFSTLNVDPSYLFHQYNVSLNDDRKQIYLETVGAPNSSLTISLSLWMSNTYCLQFNYGRMFFRDNYLISVKILEGLSSPLSFALQGTVDSIGYVDWNNSFVCVPKTTENGSLIATFDIFTTQRYDSLSYVQYTMRSLDGTKANLSFTSCTYLEDDSVINFDVGNVGLLHWTSQSCSQLKVESQSNDIINIFDLGAAVAVTIIMVFCIFALCFMRYYHTKKITYRASDPAQYGRIIWFTLYLLDSLSQKTFVYYLYLLLKQHRSNADIYIMYYFCIVAISSSHVLNIISLIHYIQIWMHALAPGVTRHWLRTNSILLIFMTVTIGCTDAAIELSNSQLLLNKFFTMHLPQSEIVLVRLYRFWSNSLCLDLPFFIVICAFLGSVNTKIITLNRFVIWNTLIISFISFLCTVLYAIMRRSYSS